MLHSDKETLSVNLIFFSDTYIQTCVLGAQKNRLNETVLLSTHAQKNRLNETVLLSTHNICFDAEIRRIIFNYALFSGGLNYVK